MAFIVPDRPSIGDLVCKQHVRKGLVDETKDGDNEVVYVHSTLVRVAAIVSEDNRFLGPDSFSHKNLHIGLARR